MLKRIGEFVTLVTIIALGFVTVASTMAYPAETTSTFTAYGKPVGSSANANLPVSGAAPHPVPLSLSESQRAAMFPLAVRRYPNQVPAGVWAALEAGFRATLQHVTRRGEAVGTPPSTVAPSSTTSTTVRTTTTVPGATTTSTAPSITNPPPWIRARPQDVWADEDLGSEEFTWISDGKGGSIWTDQPTCNEMQWAQINYGMQAARELRDAGLLASIQRRVDTFFTTSMAGTGIQYIGRAIAGGGTWRCNDLPWAFRGIK